MSATRIPVSKSTASLARSARSIAIYPSAIASRRFLGWQDVPFDLSPALAESRLRSLACEIERQFPAGNQVTLVYQTDGTVFAVLPINGRLYGIHIPGSKAPIQQTDEFQAQMLDFAVRLSDVRSTEGLQRCVAQQTGVKTPLTTLLTDTGKDVAPNRVDEPRSIIGRLMATYADSRCSRIQVQGRIRPPQLRDVTKTLELLLPVLFPGYHGPLPTDVEFESFICRRVSSIQSRINRSIRLALAYHHSVHNCGSTIEDFRDAADRIVAAFFDGLPRIRLTLDKDVQAAYENDPALPDGDHHLVVMAYPGLRAIAVYRMAHLLHVLGTPYLPRMMSEIVHSETGIDIHPGATIGHGFFVDHGTGVVIGETAIIENHVNIYQGVTIGALNFPQDDDGNLHRGAAVKRHPTIHSGTTLYANVSVLGGETEVGRDCKVGASVSLRESVDSQMVVRLDPAVRKLIIKHVSSGLTTLQEESESFADFENPDLTPELRRGPGIASS